jgi:hypothetical protein
MINQPLAFNMHLSQVMNPGKKAGTQRISLILDESRD